MIIFNNLIFQRFRDEELDLCDKTLLRSCVPVFHM